MVQILVQVQRPKTRSADVLEQSNMDVSVQAKSKLILPLPFCSIQALKGLDDAHLHWWGQFSLLSLPIHMLISSRILLTDTPGNALQASWHLKLANTIPKFLLVISQSLPPSITLLEINFHLPLVYTELSLFSLLQQSLVPFYSSLKQSLPCLKLHVAYLSIDNIKVMFMWMRECVSGSQLWASMCILTWDKMRMWTNFFCELMSELYGGWKHVCVYMYISMFWILRMCKWKCEWEHLEASDCLYLSPFVSKLTS